MAFISKSVTDATKVTTTPGDLTKIQSGFTGTIDNISKSTSDAISSKVVSPIVVTANSTNTAVNSALGSVNSALSSVNNLTKQANSFLQSAVKSISSTFDQSVKGLASGLDSALTGLFKDTNVKSASTTTTNVSDPIKTNLIATKLPASSGFKLTSFESGSQSSSSSGSTSLIGSNSGTMTSTGLSTIMDRLNFDSVNGLTNGIATTKSNSSLKSLFSTVNSAVKTVRGVSATVQAIQQVPNALAAAAQKSLSNAVQSFTGRVSSLTSLTGIDSSGYFISTSPLGLVDQNGSSVTTTGAGTDAGTANALLSLAQLVGCDLNGVNEYSSTNELDSLFNMLMSIASKQGLSSLVDSLLNCNRVTTTGGQTAIVNALLGVSNSDITITNSLLSSVSDTSVLYKNQQLANDIISNSNLTAADADAVRAALASMDYTPTEPFEISYTEDGTITIYDQNTLNSSEKAILDSLFDDNTFSTYLGGSSVAIGSDGTLWI